MQKIDIQLFWKNVETILSEEGMTWTGLAQLAGLSPQSLSSAKHMASDLRIGTLIRICSILDVKPSDLLNKRQDFIPTQKQKALTINLLEAAVSMPADESIMMLLPCLNEEFQELLIKDAERLMERNK